jgi:NADH-quinone oxidoreductase subunit F
MSQDTNTQSEQTALRVTVGDGSDDATARGRDILQTARGVSGALDVLEVGSTGLPAIEPLVLITNDGETAYHPSPSSDSVPTLIADAESGDISAPDAAWVVTHDPDVQTLPVPADGPLAVGSRQISGRCGWIDPTDGFSPEVSATTVARDDPDGALRQLDDIGVLGRGRGDASRDEPLAAELNTVRETPGDPVVVVNANESDRQNLTDRLLLEGDPAAVVDGLLAVAAIVGCSPDDTVVYTNERESLARRRIRRSLHAAVDELNDGNATPQIVSGPDEYIAGEFTMALEALEGNDRLEARLRPPGPARHGLYGRPTVVITPRSLAQIRTALLDPDAFDPDDADPGTRLFTVTGDVASDATVELPTGGSLTAVRDAVDIPEQFKMASVGGRLGGFTQSLDQTVSSVGLRNADLGTEGAIEIFDEETCPVAVAGERARFASEGNCGRCFPGREGTKQLLHLLRDVYDGQYEEDKIRELTRAMTISSLCDFGQSAARSVGTAIDRFETEFRAHANGRCPSGACEEIDS